MQIKYAKWDSARLADKTRRYPLYNRASSLSLYIRFLQWFYVMRLLLSIADESLVFSLNMYSTPTVVKIIQIIVCISFSSVLRLSNACSEWFSYWMRIFYLFVVNLLKVWINRGSLTFLVLFGCINLLFRSISCNIYWWTNH